LHYLKNICSIYLLIPIKYVTMKPFNRPIISKTHPAGPGAPALVLLLAC
jgi:hypothetical protein